MSDAPRDFYQESNSKHLAAVADTTGRAAMSPMTVRVDLNARGAWEIVLPGQPERVTCETLEAARQMAYQCAGSRYPCELIVRDAYHRVVHHELIDGDGANDRAHR